MDNLSSQADDGVGSKRLFASWQAVLAIYYVASSDVCTYIADVVYTRTMIDQCDALGLMGRARLYALTRARTRRPRALSDARVFSPRDANL